jgi:hypothetical protein
MPCLELFLFFLHFVGFLGLNYSFGFTAMSDGTPLVSDV